jgi:hypothetical protein
MGGSNS